MIRTPRPTRALSVALAGALLLGACSDDPRHEDVATEDVLASIADGVIIPSYEAAVTDLAALADALDADCADPSAEGLDTARAAWRDAELAWQATRATGVGPAVEQRAMTAIAFRIDPDKVVSLLAGSAPLDQTSVAAIGADQRGIYGVEVALFADGSDELAAASPGQARRCEYLVSATTLALEAIRNVLDAWNAEDPYRDTFIAGMDGDPISSVEAIVSEIAFRLQQADDQGLRAFVTADAYDDLPESRREGPAAQGVGSLRGILGGVAATVLGPDGELGLADLVANHSEDTADRFRELVEEAVAATAALPASSRAAIDDEGLAAAADAVAALRVLVTTEVASQLGVTIGFSDSDGDS